MIDGAVTVAYVHDGHDVTHSFAESFDQLLLHDMVSGGKIMEGGWVKMRCGTNGLVGARNRAVEAFLAADKGEWLFWIDTDMGFEPDTVDRLVARADKNERPIVGALCFAQKETDVDGYSGYRTSARATLFEWKQTSEEAPAWFTARAWYPPNGFLKVAGTGSACVLIHRSVFERMAAEYGPSWYSQVPAHDGELIGEDISFCMRAAALNIPVHVDCSVRTTHMKTLWLSEADFWDQHQPPPAIERVAVCVPVMRRPHNAAPFMRHLRASTGLATCYAIHDADDLETRDAWKLAGAELIESSGTRFGTKINDAYRATNEPWLFLAGDDVRFRAGWYDHAAYAAAASGARVIGTNDLHNPRVIRGEHATHLLIDREYVAEHGASWDGPGVVCHEGYSHWFVDDEIVTVAKQRNTFVAALGSKVEHFHPVFGNAEPDDVYAHGQKHSLHDKRLYTKRLEAHA